MEYDSADFEALIYASEYEAAGSIGTLSIQTNIPAAQEDPAEYVVQFAIQAVTALAQNLTVPVTVSIGCHSLTQITANFRYNGLYPWAFKNTNDWLTEDSTFDIYFNENAAWRFLLVDDVLTITTDQTNCKHHTIEYVTSLEGTTLARDN